MEKKNHSGKNFELGTANRQHVASLLGVRCQDKERRVFCIHSNCVFDYGWSGKRENRSIQTLSGANCTEAKIRIWYNSCTLSISLLFFPRLEHVSIPLHFFLFVCLFFFGQNQTNSVFCNWWPIEWTSSFQTTMREVVGLILSARVSLMVKVIKKK